MLVTVNFLTQSHMPAEWEEEFTTCNLNATVVVNYKHSLWVL